MQKANDDVLEFRKRVARHVERTLSGDVRASLAHMLGLASARFSEVASKAGAGAAEAPAGLGLQAPTNMFERLADLPAAGSVPSADAIAEKFRHSLQPTPQFGGARPGDARNEFAPSHVGRLAAEFAARRIWEAMAAEPLINPQQLQPWPVNPLVAHAAAQATLFAVGQPNPRGLKRGDKYFSLAVREWLDLNEIFPPAAEPVVAATRKRGRNGT
jgi:hypothetical protein